MRITATRTIPGAPATSPAARRADRASPSPPGSRSARSARDTGGSIRLPAACCGIVGLKPTYGRVSRAGVMPLSWSNDHVGPMARTVRDAARLLQVIAGRDPRDATSSHRAVPDYMARHRRGRRRASRRGAGELLLPRARRRDGGRRAGGDPTPRDAGRAGRRSCACPIPRSMSDVCNVIARCESAAVHTRLVRERPEEIQPVVRARLELGFRIPAHDYLQALRLRARLTRDVHPRRSSRRPTSSWRRSSPSPRRRSPTPRRAPVGDRRAPGTLLPAHAPLQRARAAGALRAVRLLAPGSPPGLSDRRAALRRGDRASRRATPTSSRRAGTGGARRSTESRGSAHARSAAGSYLATPGRAL